LTAPKRFASFVVDEQFAMASTGYRNGEAVEQQIPGGLMVRIFHEGILPGWPGVEQKPQQSRSLGEQRSDEVPHYKAVRSATPSTSAFGLQAKALKLGL
jgi:hypothetical protein